MDAGIDIDEHLFRDMNVETFENARNANSRNNLACVGEGGKIQIQHGRISISQCWTSGWNYGLHILIQVTVL
jgi:hypothetical protein